MPWKLHFQLETVSEHQHLGHETIYELETENEAARRAIGYLSATGDMDFAIAIRTIRLKNQIAYAVLGQGLSQFPSPKTNTKKPLTRLNLWLELEN